MAFWLLGCGIHVRKCIVRSTNWGAAFLKNSDQRSEKCHSAFCHQAMHTIRRAGRNFIFNFVSSNFFIKLKLYLEFSSWIYLLLLLLKHYFANCGDYFAFANFFKPEIFSSVGESILEFYISAVGLWREIER